MDNFRLNLLELIKQDYLTYFAEGGDQESLQEFERVAAALADFETAGLIEIQSKISEVVSGQERVISVSVQRLTAAGKQKLEMQSQ